MQEISHLTKISNNRVRQADPASAFPLNHVAYATGLAQAAFGYFYAYR